MLDEKRKYGRIEITRAVKIKYYDGSDEVCSGNIGWNGLGFYTVFPKKKGEILDLVLMLNNKDKLSLQVEVVWNSAVTVEEIFPQNRDKVRFLCLNCNYLNFFSPGRGQDTVGCANCNSGNLKYHSSNIYHLGCKLLDMDRKKWDQFIVYLIDLISGLQQSDQRMFPRIATKIIPDQVEVKLTSNMVESNTHREEYIRNVSKGGLQIVSSQQYQVNDELIVVLRSEFGSLLRICAQIVNLVSAPEHNNKILTPQSEKLYKYGVKFIDFDQTQKEQIITFMMDMLWEKENRERWHRKQHLKRQLIKLAIASGVVLLAGVAIYLIFLNG